MIKKYSSQCINCEAIVEYNRQEKPKNCPNCGYGDNNYEWKKPPTETQLFIIQNKYLKTKDKKYLDEMYLLLRDYAEGKIKKSLNGLIHYDIEKLSEKAHDAATQFIEYYLKKPGFRVDFSFGGFLSWQIKAVLWNKHDQENDKNYSLNSLIKESNKEKFELNNFVNLFSKENIMSSISHKLDLIRGIEIIISDIMNKLRSEYDTVMSLKVLIGIKNYIEGISDKNKYSYYDKYGRYEIKDFVDKSMMLIYSFIQGNH